MRLHTALLLAILLAGLPALSTPGVGGIDWLPVVEVAHGGGIKGPWKQNDSHYDYVDDGTVAFTPNGALLVAWVDQRRKDVLLQVRGADGRPQAAPVDVSRSPATFSWMPRIASAGPDTVYVLWQEIIFSGGSHGGDILFAHSADGGRSFSAPRNLSRSIGGDGKGRLDRDTWSNGSLDLAAGPDGSVHAAWTEYDGALWLARSRDGGRSFTPPQRIAGDKARPARGPSLAVGSKGQVYLAWTVGEDPDADIRVSQSLDDGASFAPPVLVGLEAARADAPALALDRQGRLHLVYMEHAGSQPPVIRYARSAAPALRFGPSQTLPAPSSGVAAPHIAADQQGHVHIAWEAGPRGSVPAPGLYYTVDTGAGFSDPVAVPQSRRGGRTGSQQGLLGKQLAAGSNGMIALVGSALMPGRESRVWLTLGRAKVSCQGLARDGSSGVAGKDGRLERVKGIEPSS